ncbi:MAG: short-chain dehydrogenase [Desulfuromonas sp.]|nr:MAG: short-chain dehydrogenase [Desulfuromonas sp.]
MTETILITGANRGIGLELARTFSANGWDVLACCRHPEKADDLQNLIADNNHVHSYALDVTDQEAVRRLAVGLKDRPIDILFNNAGIFGPREQGFGDVDPEAWLEVLRTNVVAPMKMIEAFIAQVTAGQRKIVASMGSMMGSIADNNSGGYYIYRSSKAAVHMVMKSLAIDLHDQSIISVVFHPGWVRTDMGGSTAPTTPQESAAGLYRVLTGLTTSDSGKLLTYKGEQLPW